MTRAETISFAYALENNYTVDLNLIPDFARSVISMLSFEPTKWREIEEEVPPLGEYVLCACRANIYDVLKRVPDGWFHDLNHIYRYGFVVAWQPLPDFYKGGKPI